MFGVTQLADDKMKGARFVVENPKHIASPSVLGTLAQTPRTHHCGFTTRSPSSSEGGLGVPCRAQVPNSKGCSNVPHWMRWSSSPAFRAQPSTPSAPRLQALLTTPACKPGNQKALIHDALGHTPG